MERVLFKHHHQAFLWFWELSKFSKEYVEKEIVLTLKFKQDVCILKGTHKNQVISFKWNKFLGFIFTQNVIQTQDSWKHSRVELRYPEFWEIPLISFGLVHALQRSVLQQLQPLLAQLSSVVQPFSPLSVTEKRKRISFHKCNGTLFLTAEVQKPQKKKLNTSELSDEHTVTPAVPTTGWKTGGTQDAGLTNQRTGFEKDNWREEAEQTVVAQAFRMAGKTRHDRRRKFNGHLTMSHLGCNRPVCRDSCSLSACSWPPRSLHRNTWF